MKLKILLERPTIDYSRESFVYKTEVYDYKLESGALWLYRSDEDGNIGIWRIFNCSEWSEIAVDEDELILYTEPKKPSGPATTGKVVPLRKE